MANTQDRVLDDSLIDLMVEIENAAKSKGLDCFLLKTIVCPRNVYYVRRFAIRENATEFFRRINERLT